MIIMHKKSRELFILSRNNQQLFNLSLGDVPEGQHPIIIDPKIGFFEAWIEGIHQEWCIRCGRDTWIEITGSSNNHRHKFIKLPESGKFELCESNGNRVIVYIYPNSSSQIVCEHYSIENLGLISIGRSEQNEIQVYNPLTSREHLIIRRENGKLKLVDLNSTLGSRLNGERVTSAFLEIGDCIEIPGLSIYIGIEFLSLKADSRVYKVKSLKKILNPIELSTCYAPQKIEPMFPFVRRPRIRAFHSDIQQIEIELPPPSLKSDQIPLALRMGGSAVYSGMSALSGNFTSMLSSVLFPILSSKYTDKQKAEYEERRTRRYTAYLNQKYNEIQRVILEEKRELEENNPSPKELNEMIKSRIRLWERRPIDSDFLNLRIGVTNKPLKSQIQFPKRSFGMDEDPLQEKMFRLSEYPYVVEKAPLSIDLIEQFILGVRGTREDREHLFLTLLCELCYLHSPEEVRIIILAEEDFLYKYPEILYLPHVWNEEEDFRFIATTPSECSLISRQIFEQVMEAKNKKYDREELSKNLPYTIVFSFSNHLLQNVVALNEILVEDKNLGISIIALSDLLPNACKQLLDLLEKPNPVLLQLRHQEEKDIFFNMDNVKVSIMRNLLNQISNIQTEMKNKKEVLPKMLTFLEMYQKSKIEQFSLIQQWRNSNPVKSLSAPIGVHPDGTLFTLDLHENFQGPHGLIAGMTGSGKSEFIITYILSLALNYHPDELSFILIDFKGGGLTGAFENKTSGVRLPHLAGTITNLDESTIFRALLSIESELKRRETIFNEAKAKVNEGTMDIYKYQQLYRNGLVKEPISHLFIISDEFAELKSQHHEFMDQLISTARIGRSLGVHLILATQKPAGIVTDQIWSNTRFRVCLKVQDRSDSMEMIKRREAAELKETGRFYLQVGYNEYFALGQSAWSGAPYEPSDRIQTKKDEEIIFIDPTGQAIFSAKSVAEKKEKSTPQLVAIMEYLSKIAQENKIASRKLWLDPLPSEIEFQDLEQPKKEYQIILGRLDNPVKQEQLPFLIDFNKTRNIMILGEAGSGKSTLLQTMIISLIQNHSPKTLHLYLADLSGKTMGFLRESNSVGTLLLRPEVQELSRLVNLIIELLEERKEKFMNWKISRFEEAKSEKELPLILFIIDGLDEIPDDSKGREIHDQLVMIAREGPSYGIQFIFTVTNVRNVKSRLKNEINFNLPLRLKEIYSYLDFFGKRPSFMPESYPGRGLVLYNHSVVEYQGAKFGIGKSDQLCHQLLESFVEYNNNRYKGFSRPKGLVMLDLTQDYKSFIKGFSNERLPIGIRLSPTKPLIIPFQQFFLMAIYFGNEECRPLLWEALNIASVHNGAKIIGVGSNLNSLSFLKPDRIFDLSLPDSISAFVEYLFSIVLERKEIRNQICEELGIDTNEWQKEENVKKWRKELRKRTEPLFIIIDSLAELGTRILDSKLGILKTILKSCAGFNLYIMAGFSKKDSQIIDDMEKKFEETEDARKYQGPRKNTGELTAFFSESPILLLGGCYDKQRLINLPYAQIISKTLRDEEKNQGIFCYNGKKVELIFPMGDLSSSKVEDEDEIPFI